MSTIRRVSYVLLSSVPFLDFAVVGIRALRVSGVHQAIGAAYFGAIAAAAWTLGARTPRVPRQDRRLVSLAGVLLLTPFALVSLLWVGLGGPWEATVAENQMRYLVLMAMAIAVVAGFVVLKEALAEAGERFYATLGFAAIILSGPLYLLWNALFWGIYWGKEHAGHTPEAIVSLGDALDVVLDLGVVLTYLATAAFAASLGRVQWLGRRTTEAFVIVSFLALLLLAVRGLAYQDPNALTTPWYTNPGFIVGIPAVPYIMPFLLGVVLLRRAGE